MGWAFLLKHPNEMNYDQIRNNPGYALAGVLAEEYPGVIADAFAVRGYRHLPIDAVSVLARQAASTSSGLVHKKAIKAP